MKKNEFKNSLWHGLYWLVIMIGLISASNVEAQTTVTIGAGSQSGTQSNGATGDCGPMYRSTATSNFVYSRHHYLYTAAELSAIPAGDQITKLAWNNQNGAGTNSPCIFQIWIKNSSLTDVGAGGQLWSNLISGSTQVYNNAAHTVPAVAGWHEITLTTPFTYTGGAIEISVNFDISAGTSPWTTAGFSWFKDPITGRTLSFVNSTPPSTTLPNLRTVRAQLQITHAAGSPCVAPPTPGTANAVPSTGICVGQNITLSLSGNSSGSGQTYQWQSASNIGGPYTNIGASSPSSGLTIPATGTVYYRCEVTCSGNSQLSTPVLVTPNPSFPGGNYTINAALPTGGTNFQTFNAFVSALNCGIAGAVVVDVVSGSGPYNEQVIFPAVLNTSSTNTITINGNGNTLTFGATVSTAPSTLELNGTDYMIVNNLNFAGTGTTYAFAAHLWNNADNNQFNNCTFTVPGNLSTTTLVPFSISGSVSSATGTGSSGINNVITGCTMNHGYYGAALVGNSASPATGNRIENCQVNDHYIYGIYLSYQNGTEVKGNTIERPTRTTFSTFYGIYMTTATTNLLIHGNSLKNPMNATQSTTTAAYGIYAATGSTAGNENRVYNNIVSDFNTNGTQWGIYVYGYFLVYHNTIVLDNAASTAGETRGVYMVSGGTGTYIQNNIISITRSGTGIKHCLYFAAATSVSNNNVLHMNAPAGTNYIGYRTTSYATLSAWQSGTSYDLNSIDVDPILSAFVPGNGLVNDFGTPVGILTDFNGAARSLTAPDPGAIEFSLGGLDASISWVSPLSPTSAGLKTITVNIASTQAQTITSLDLSYNDGSGPVTQSFTGLNITGGTNQDFSFSTQYNLTGNATITVDILSVNGGADAISGNNTDSYVLCLALSGTYTINSANPTGGTNFQTFNDAVAAMSCGITGPVVFNVVSASGPYTEQVNIPAITGSSAVNTITFNGNGNILTNGLTVGNYATLNLNGADYLIFNNLIITASDATNGFAVHLMGGADNNTFSGCIMNASLTGTGTTTACISMSGSTTSYSTTGINGSNNTFTGCTLNGGYFGFVAYGDASVPANNSSNSLINCTISNYYVYGAYNYYQSGNIFRGNIFERPTRTTISTFYGIYVSTCRNLLIEKNRIRKGFEGNQASTSIAYCIYLTGDAAIGEEHRIINNVISDMRSAGTQYGIYSTGADYWNAYHNTISFDHTAATAGSTYGIYSSGTLAYDVRNNLISVTRGGTGSKWCVYYVTPAAATSNYNNLYMNSAAGTNNLGYNGTSYATLAAWQAGSGKDANSTSENPLYFNPAANNYKPTQSAMDNIGTPLSVADDIIGALRSPSAPDAGAYEFSVAAKDVGVFAFLGPNPDGCYTNAETIEVQIKNYGTQMIDFSVDPVTVNCVITGPVNTTVSATLTTGTLMPTATLNVSLAPTINGTTNGTYLLNATTVMTSDGEPINDAYPEITLEVGPVAGVISSTLNSICVSDDPVLTAVGVYGGDIQWQESTVSATGPWTNVGTNSATYSPIAVTQTTWYRALTVCNANDASSNVVEIIVNTPLITSTIPGTRCGIGTVGLSATGSGSTINWYNSPSSQTALSTGASFTTPVISSSTTYYVATSDGGGTANLGLPNRVGATSNSGYSDVGLMFDASVSFTLQSVAVYPIASTPSGNVTATIALKDNAGVILQSTTVSLPTSVLPGIKTLVPLNFIVPAGTQHRLVFTSATGGGITGFIRESSTGYVYPYTLPGVASITSAYTSGASSAYYYYFYDWTVVTGCESARVPVVATVTPAPTMSVTANDITLCPGGSTTVNVTSSNDPDYTYSWTSNPAGFTASGAGPHSISPTATTWYVVTATDNSAGPNTGCVAIDSVQVFTGATLASGNVSSSDVSFCASGTPTLSVAGSDGGAIQWQQSTISSGGPWTNVGTPSTVYAPGTITQTTWYRVRVYCQSSEVFSNVVEVNVNNPQLLSSTPGSRCGAGTVNLAATADPGSTINWYANATGGAPLGTGPSFTTPVITTTTDFYAAASVGGSGNQNVGKTSITTTATVVGTYYLNFTVYVPTTIASVKCYFNAIGTPFILNIRDAGTLASVFTASGTTTVNGTVTPQTITLNATLAPGNYQMGWSTDPGTYRESTGATYPYAIPGIISITGNTFNDLNYYYYFYDWSVVTGCEGLRTAVTATVNPSPAITAVSGASTVCSGNPTTVSVSSSNDPNYTYSWTSTPAGFTATGAGPHTVNPTAASTTYTVSAVDNTAGPFSGCGALNTVVISTTPNSLSATATATPSSVCLGSDVQLQVTASSSGYSMNTSCATSFIDISVSGTSIGTVADDSEHNIPVPSFTFNGVTYTQAVVGMNGVIVLGATSGDITLTNAALPTTSVAAGNVFLAPYWDDLDINLGATVKYQTVGNIFIIQWTNTDHNLFTTGGITFQVQMNLVTGVVTYIYPDAVFGSATYDLGLTATIGIQMSSTSAVQYSFNTASLTNGQCINFTPVSPAVTYDWSANSTFLTSTSIANPIAEAVTSDQTYSVTVTQTSTGCIKVATVPVITLALPDPLIGSNAPVCQGQDIALFGSNEALGQTTGNSFSWTGPNGFLSGSQNPTVTGVTTASVGYYVLTVQNSFGCTEVDSINVQLFDSPALNILSQTNVACNGALTGAYTVEVTNPIPFGNYLYNDGTNTQFNDGTFTGVGAGTYNVEVTDDNSCSTTIPVTITEPDPTTTANAGTDQSSCLGNTATLAGNTALVGTGSWTVTAGGATVTDPSDPNSTVTGLTAGLNTFRWTIDNALCANSNFDEVDITTNVLPTASISGTTEICNGNSTTLTVVFTGTAPYTYSYSNGVTTFGPFTTSNTTENITVAPTATRTYTITAVDDSNCPGTPSGSAVVTVTQAPPANSVFIVSSPATGCVGNAAVVNVNPVIGATLYTWTVFPNTLINGQSGGVATTTVPTATFTLGSLPANESGWDICVTASNACGQTNTKCLTIRGALSTPAVISGTTVACASSSGTYSTGTVAGASGYSWTGTNGITFSGSGTSITANFPSGFTSGQICVAATLSCGYTGPQRCITVTSSVSQLGLMSGPFAVCPGQSGLVFSVPANSGLSSYTWTAPSGVTITSGQGTNSVTVSVAPGFNLGSMCVTGTSNCGIVSAARCKTVSSTLPLTPGNISGASTGVCNQTITYSVPALSGVTSYNWTAPIGATVVSGQGTNTVDISYPNGFSNGQLCVTAQNGCGISAARCINIKGVPASPGVISGPVTVCTGEQGLTYSIAAMFGASSYTWVVPAGSSIIAGQGTSSIIVDWGTTSGLVTVTATNSCGVSGTRTLNVIVNCKLSGNEIPGVLVNAYPNPVASELTVEVSSEKANDYALELTDVSGRVVYSGQMNTTGGMKTTTVDVSTLSKGMYMLTVRSNDGFTNQIRVAVQ